MYAVNLILETRKQSYLPFFHRVTKLLSVFILFRCSCIKIMWFQLAFRTHSITKSLWLYSLQNQIYVTQRLKYQSWPRRMAHSTLLYLSESMFITIKHTTGFRRLATFCSQRKVSNLTMINFSYFYFFCTVFLNSTRYSQRCIIQRCMTTFAIYIYIYITSAAIFTLRLETFNPLFMVQGQMGPLIGNCYDHSWTSAV